MFSMKVSGAAVLFACNVLIARMLGSGDFGVYTLIMSLVALAATGAGFGLPYLITREVARMKAVDRFEGFAALFWRAIFIMLCAVVVIYAIAVIAKWSGSFGILRGVPLIIISMAVGIVALQALNQHRAAILRGLGWVLRADLPDVWIRPWFIAVALLAFLHPGSFTISTALQIQLLAGGVALASGIVFQRQCLRRVGVALAGSGVQRGGGGGISYRTATTFFLVTVVALLDQQAVVYVVGYLMEIRDVGVLQAARQIIGVVSLGSISISLFLQSRLAVAWAARKFHEAQSLVRMATRWNAAFSLVCALLIAVFGSKVVGLYGHDYAHSLLIVEVLMVGQVINAFTGQTGLVLMLANREGQLLRFEIAFLLLRIPILLVGAGYDGLLGAVWGENLAMLLSKLSAVVYVRRRTGLRMLP